MNQTPLDRLLDDFVKIMLNVIGDCHIQTGMTVDEEEKRREELMTTLLSLSSTAMVDVAQRVITLARQYLGSHPRRGYLTLRLLEETIGCRYSKKFLTQHRATIVLKDPRHEIMYTLEEEDVLRNLFIALKGDIPEADRSRVDMLLEIVTGSYAQ